MAASTLNMPAQLLTLELEGITADDYLQWVRDPDPPALGHALQSVSLLATPCGDTIIATLQWNGPAPEPRRAAVGAGLPLLHGVRLRPANEPRTRRSLVQHIRASAATLSAARGRPGEGRRARRARACECAALADRR